ncbi:MAG: hypothetical protein ACI8UD_002743 [Planctomycetota bacterium]|jgi:hypothetical protein
MRKPTQSQAPLVIARSCRMLSTRSFASPVSVPLLAASVAITQTDLDSDGVLDLIAVGSDQISVLFGTGIF